MTPGPLLCLGDNVVDRYLDLGVMQPGGNAVNVAVHATRLGTPAAYLGVLGTDASADLVGSALRDEGVDVSRVRIVEGPNAYANIRLVDGNRVFGGANVGVSRFRLTTADLADLAGFELVHTGECSQVEEQLPDIAGAARRVSYDFSERPWAYVAALAGQVDVAIASRPSASRDEAVELAKAIADVGPGTVAVTRGAHGGVLLSPKGIHAAGAGDGPILDTLGAGDAFIARFLVGLLAGEDEAHLLQAATSYATACCAFIGAFGHPGAPIQPVPEAATPTSHQIRTPS